MTNYEEGETTVEVVKSPTTDVPAIMACAGETGTVEHVEEDEDDVLLDVEFDGLYNPATEEPLELTIQEQHVRRV